jgi:hypothetical protein
VIKFVAMCGETNGADEWNYIGGDGIVLGIAEASAAKGGRELKNGEVERGEGSGERGEVLIEGLIENGELGDERGVPRIEGWEVIYVGVMENISGKIVGGGGLGTRAEKLAFSL